MEFLATADEKAHLLYVEDEDLNWEIAELTLRKKYRVTRARDAREAFDLLSTQAFALVLMDIQLSGSDFSGIEITQIIKGKFSDPIPAYAERVLNPDIAIIFVTAYTARYSKADLLAVGGSELIPKPVNFTSLSLAITRLLSRSVLEKLKAPR